MKRILIVSVIFLLTCINVFAKDTNTNKAFTTVTKGLVGEWVNELGSTLKITDIDSSSGRISGIYNSSSGTSGKSFPLIGWVNHQIPQPAIMLLSYASQFIGASTEVLQHGMEPIILKNRIL